MSSSMYNIEKLNESNYDSWSLQMRSVLVHQDLWDVVSGDEVKPEASNEAAQLEVSRWVRKDDKAMATIILCATPLQIAHIKNNKTSKEAWNTLKEIHQPKGPMRKVELFKQLLSMKMDDNEGVQQYICKFTSTVEKLAEIGITLQEELFVIMLLASLPKSYENFVVALETRDDLPRLSTLKVKLTEEGERRKTNINEITDADSSTEAFMVRTNNSKHQHFVKKRNNNDNKSNKSVMRKPNSFSCYNCGRKGHYAAQCKEKEKKREQTQASFSALSALDSNVFKANTWCVDSGASSHLCSDRKMFVSFKAHDENICMADNQNVKAEGIGKVCIKTATTDIELNDVLFVPQLRYNFISVGKTVANNYSVEFTSKSARIINCSGEIILKANKVGDLFLFDANFNHCFFTCNERAITWHNR